MDVSDWEIKSNENELYVSDGIRRINIKRNGYATLMQDGNVVESGLKSLIKYLLEVEKLAEFHFEVK